MRETPKPTVLLFFALGLALLANALLRGAAWGVNVGLWTIAITGAGALLARPHPLRLSPSQKGFAGAAVLFALLFSLRDSNALKIANGFALLLCVGAMVLPNSGQSLKEAGVVRLLFGSIGAFFALPGDAYALAEKVQKEREASPDARERNRAVVRGLLLATPLLVVFGALFSSADAIFRGKIEDVFRFDPDFAAISGHFWTFLFALLFAGGLLHRILLYTKPTEPPVVRPGFAPFVGIIEIGIVLGSLVLLFGSFLAVQFRYLFMARDVVNATEGLSYAEYARGGFFELVWVAALALLVLLGAGALLKRERPIDDKVYRGLGRLLVVMVFLVVLSALTRMRLYTETYGLTELRIYSTVFMVWLTVAFLLLLATTLRGRPQGFALGIFLAGLSTIALTNFANPDALIVRTNLQKPRADFDYLKTLSDDAALALRGMGDRVPPEHRAAAQNFVRRRAETASGGDWRESNLARWSLGRRGP